MKIKLAENVLIHSETKRREYFYQPVIKVFLMCNHKIGINIKCLIDTGAVYNIFPAEYATNYLGFTDKSLKRGKLWNIMGVGNARTIGYGFNCDIHNPNFRIDHSMVYFVAGQPYPLLGMSGFIDHFEHMIVNFKHKTLELKNFIS